MQIECLNLTETYLIGYLSIMGLSDFFIDPTSLPQDFYGLCQLISLGLVYIYLLMYGSNLISDGSELLLLVPAYSGIIGSILLPILGAVSKLLQLSKNPSKLLF